MIQDQNYRFFFALAVGLHIFLAVALMWEPSNERPALTMEVKNQSVETPASMASQEQAIQAVAVDQKEVMAAVTELKKEREQQKIAEMQRQKMLAQQAEQARQKRLQEQQRLEKLKKESEMIALQQKKKLEEEKKKMQELAQKQAQQKKELQALEDKQRELQKQKNIEEQRLAAVRAQQATEAKARELEEKKKQELALKAAQDAAKQARVAGVVDRYKALIINAISERWILPDQVDRHLFSQFRIRLAPNGTVLEVTLTKSSGDPILDRSAQAAIYKASPLPVPSDPEVFGVFRDITLTVRPENAQG